MKKEEVIKILKEVKCETEQKFKARVKGIFGSYVRGEDNDKSDIDVLVEFEEEANLLHFVGLSLFLEEKLHLAVDIVPYDSVREEIKDYIFKEAIYL